MKKLILLILLLATLGCTFVDNAKKNLKEELEGYELAVVNDDRGFVYLENGKFYYKKDVTAEPREISSADALKYSAKTLIK